MATNVTRDHHNLRRNLKLNGNYLSNDGGDEGISIQDDGDVIINGDKKLYLNDAGGEYLNSDGTDLTIVSGGKVLIDKDIDNTTAATASALHIDLDRVGDVSSGTDIVTGLDIDVNQTGGSGGIIAAKGIDLDIVGDNGGSATTAATGIGVTVSGVDASTGMEIVTVADIDANSIGLYIKNENGGTDFKNVSSAAVGDYFTINTIEDGETTLTTVENGGGSTAHLNMVADGNFTVDAEGNIILDAASGITKFYVNGDTDDLCTLRVSANGATKISTADSDGALGHLTIGPDGHVEFDNCAVGFDRLEAGFSDTDVIESGGSNDTDIDFRLSNKYRLELSGDIAQMNLIFPNTSGNFLITCHILAGGGGDHDVTAWKVWEHDSVAGATNAAATTDVMWAGGSAPTFTSGASTDIVSFYWDADEQQAYGVASLAFATP